MDIGFELQALDVGVTRILGKRARPGPAELRAGQQDELDSLYSL